MYFFQSSPVSYKRFIKRFPTENSLIKLYAKTCVDFDIESKPKKRRCPHCGSGKTWLQQGNEINIKQIEAR